MLYRNKETGAVFESDVRISGGGWAEDKTARPQSSGSETEKKPAKKRTARKTKSG